jgi:hypothetical protein
VDQHGQVLLNQDVYGTDDQLATALGLSQAARRSHGVEPSTDYGP